MKAATEWLGGTDAPGTQQLGKIDAIHGSILIHVCVAFRRTPIGKKWRKIGPINNAIRVQITGTVLAGSGLKQVEKEVVDHHLMGVEVLHL